MREETTRCVDMLADLSVPVMTLDETSTPWIEQEGNALVYSTENVYEDVVRQLRIHIPKFLESSRNHAQRLDRLRNRCHPGTVDACGSNTGA